MARQRRGFGAIRKLPSKRYQASYTVDETRYTAPVTYEAKGDAEEFLATVRRAITSGEWTPRWTPPDIGASPGASTSSETVLFGTYARAWLADRTLRPRPRQDYEDLLGRLIEPTFGDVPLTEITPSAVRTWHTKLGTNAKTQRARAYGLLRTILGQAARDGEITTNPCHIRGAGNVKRRHKIEPASPAQVVELAAAVPDRFEALILLAAWCGFRWGELTEMRRKDVVLDAGLGFGVVKIRRAVVRVRGEFLVTDPKSDAGIRDVEIPPHLLPVLVDHLDRHTRPEPEALLFPSAGDPSRHLAPSSFYKTYYPAREAVGLPNLRVHDLRHTGAVLAAMSGATLAELMARLGHSTAGAAMRYQHAAQDRDRQLAQRLSALALETVTNPLK